MFAAVYAAVVPPEVVAQPPKVYPSRYGAEIPLVAVGYEMLLDDFVNDTTYVLSSDKAQPQITGRFELFQIASQPLGKLALSVYIVNAVQFWNA